MVGALIYVQGLQGRWDRLIESATSVGEQGRQAEAAKLPTYFARILVVDWDVVDWDVGGRTDGPTQEAGPSHSPDNSVGTRRTVQFWRSFELSQFVS